MGFPVDTQFHRIASKVASRRKGRAPEKRSSMLTIADQRPGTSRRELLRLGSLGLADLSLPSLLASRAAATGARDNPLKDKCVIFLFQQGGPSQLETFDPKMDAPSEVRTVGGTTRTSLTGVHYGATMQRLAKLAHKLTVVRSFTTRNAGHNIQPIVSPSSHEANIGTHYARVAGATRRLSGMPTNAVIFPRTVLPGAPKPEARGNLAATGPDNLISTLLNTMIDIGKLRLAPNAPKEVLKLASSSVIPGVVTG